MISGVYILNRIQTTNGPTVQWLCTLTQSSTRSEEEEGEDGYRTQAEISDKMQRGFHRGRPIGGPIDQGWLL